MDSFRIIRINKNPRDMKEILKIKRVVGCILKEDKVFLRVLWEDKLVTWESPDTLCCPLLFTNFLNKVDGLLQKKAFEEEKIRKKEAEKSFISSIRSKEPVQEAKTIHRVVTSERNKVDCHQTKTTNKRTEEPELHKKYKSLSIANQKNARESARLEKYGLESFGQKSSFGLHKPQFKVSNKTFLNNQRYFEAPQSKPASYTEKKEIEIQSKENDFVVQVDSQKVATFSYVNIVSNLTMPFNKHFNVTHTVSLDELENIMFSARQNAAFGNFDVYNLKLLNNNGRFRDLLQQAKDNHVFVDVTSSVSFVLFFVFNSSRLRKYDICGYYNLVRLPAEMVKYVIDARIDRSLCDSYNLWQKSTVHYADRVLRYFLVCSPNLVEDKIHRFSIFANSSNFMASEIRKFLTSRGKKYVTMEHTEIDTVFIHVEYLQFLNNMPFYFSLVESNCSFYFFGASIIKREGYFLAPMLKEGGILLLLDSFSAQINDQYLSQVIAFLKKDNLSKWQLIVSSDLVCILESMLCQTPNNNTIRNILFLSQNSVVKSDGFVPEEHIKNLRKKNLLEKRYFYIIDPKQNDNLHKTPKQLLNIIDSLK
ncbi:hypothetical protein THOM_0107 [Trachipleistophora hominis]|uniref:Chromo domain-containing protein n=1 Tax=Trachipleistophora hominis TaxID=72359 RepID=L7K0D0_TRAHO|nr:hypothetical protein THOM_0107 [Trachipleistophora hominis]